MLPSLRTALLLGAAALSVAILAPVPSARSAAPDQVENEISKMKQGILDAQQQLLELLESSDTSQDRNAKNVADSLKAEIAARTAELEKLQQMLVDIREHDAKRAAADEINGIKEQLDESREQIAALNEQLAALEKEREAEPMDQDAVIRVYRLKFLAAADAAQTVSSILGSRLRVAVDARANSLVVAGTDDDLAQVSNIVETLDVESGDNDFDPAAAGEEADDKASEDYAYAKATRSLLVRVYWLADGVADDEGTPPIGPLPQSVVDAVGKLGLDNPRLIGQTVNSLSRDGNPNHEVVYQSRVSALLFKRPVHLQCSGRISPVRDDRVDLSMELQAKGNYLDTELNGSLTVPLGHYMVLGTANSVSDASSEEERNARLRILRAQQEAQQEAAEYEERGRGGGVAPPAEVPDPKYATSRFAFVVQVVEGESFSGE